ncbi:hypothetical protein AN478_05915 [Thiohalorhabdus denitrificans]|nr:hypothetical protein AN478_05915 [Thiohalorhabdus denitrificans]
MILAGLLVAGGCQGPGAGTPIPEAESAEGAAFRNQCSRCHALPHPERHTYDQWRHYLELMDQRREERGMKALTGTDRERVVTYLRKHAKNGED